ncbi:MAG TPA: ABC transporter permease [Azospirillaceae bacterium]|nr:ABC transporter permease [Azospirillaceae bacterium]
MTAASTDLAAGARMAAGPARSNFRLFLHRFVQHRAAVVSLFILVAMATAAACAPLIASALNLDPNAVKLLGRFKPPSEANWLGTDQLGRDVFIRLLHGGRISLMAGLFAAFVAAIIGTTIGLISGYVGGRTDAVMMRLTDAIISLPALPLYIVLAAVDLSKIGLGGVAQSEMASLYRIILIVAIAGWTTVARLVRGATLAARQREYVRAARALGAGHWRIMLVHILPNIASPIVVATTLSIGNVILIESVLSFLGLGIQPPLPSWGNMLTNAQELIWRAPMLAVYPGLCIFVTVICFNFLGDGLQDALDPRAQVLKR